MNTKLFMILIINELEFTIYDATNTSIYYLQCYKHLQFPTGQNVLFLNAISLQKEWHQASQMIKLR